MHAAGRLLRACLVGVAVLVPVRSSGQPAPDTPVASAPRADSAEVEERARQAQRRFEARRVRLLPPSYEGLGGRCDEVVGRICIRFGEGEWYPVPEDPEITRMRLELLLELDSLQALAPSSGWIMGQRVWYRANWDEWPEALRTARACGAVDRWWCLALEGFALHGQGRYTESLRVFQEAFFHMDGVRAARWRVPHWSVDGRAQDILGTAAASPFGTARELEWLWMLADPLFLVEGNDRQTAHYARWTVTELRGRARNPFLISWGEDLTQLTVRHGWQMGWERVPSQTFGNDDTVVGHDHPLGRDYMPPGAVLAAPAEATAQELVPRVRAPRSLYAPRYAPVLLPMDAQVGVFPRGETMVVVASHFLPQDTTFHAEHDHPLPWMEPGEQEGLEDRAGLFAVPLHGDAGTRSRELFGRTEGASFLVLPRGDYVVSTESWSPSRMRAGRQRLGVKAREAPPDVATLSDVILLRPGEREPATLEEAVDLLLRGKEIRPRERFAIGWEVSGLGFRPETLAFEVSVERVGRGVLSRIGDFFGIGSPPSPIVLSWDEPGPDRPTHLFRYLELELPDLEVGEYEIRLAVRTEGRSDAVRLRRFTVASSS